MPQFEELLAEIERKRRGRLWLTAVPVAAALVLLAVTVWQVAEARRELFRTQREIADRRQELERVQRDLNQKKKELDFLGKAIWNAGPQSAMQAIGKAVDAEPALAQVAGRIYLHIRDENQRPKAREIGQKLRSQGYIVPGIERVRQGPPSSQVRYFKRADAEEGRRLAEALRKAGLEAEAEYVPGHEDSKILRARHFEVWLGPGG
jgi:hypothetical protein